MPPANLDYDIFMGAMVGFAGLTPTIEAIKRGKRIALANKETLVSCRRTGYKSCSERIMLKLFRLIPNIVQSFNALAGENPDEVEKLILTASGGPFGKEERRI